MNLRGFHAFLIFLSAALAGVFGLWCVNLYSHDGGVSRLIAAIIAFLVAAGLLAYDSWFLRKTRALR